MTKVLVLYYSSWGHMAAMADAAAAGAKEAGAHVDVKRVAETVPEDVQKAYHYKQDHKAPIAAVDDLANYDAIIFATPTRYGMMAGQMKNFIDQTGGLWMKGALVGKVGSVMAGAANQHGGQESTILSFHTSLLHHGMVIVGCPIHSPDKWDMMKFAAVRLMVRPPRQAAMAAACLLNMN